MVYSIIISVIIQYNPIIYYFPGMVVENIRTAINMSDFLYYEFVSLTTHGYGGWQN
jgi:hypothetical protein